MKIGIITHYYRNLNYGGSLQSYALCKVLRDMGWDAEQICYDMQAPDAPKSLSRRMKETAKRLKRELLHPKAETGWRVRKNKFFSFQESIPHSKDVYHKGTIHQAAEQYDAFVTGSDQVWNTKWYHPAFFLDFVPQGKKKIAYAASLGKTETDEECRRIFEKHLNDFHAISVREADAVDMVAACTAAPVVQTLDPTMLLTAEQWDELCTDRMVKAKYVFCFFLGDGEKERQAAAAFAAKEGLKIVTLPHFPCKLRAADQHFGDIPLYNISPADFLSLIKHAEHVFTDSFHATVFSGIYKKSVFVFDRNDAPKMHSRIVSLLSFYGCEERFLDSPEKRDYAYLHSLKDIAYSQAINVFDEERRASITFLKNSMEGNDEN